MSYLEDVRDLAMLRRARVDWTVTDERADGVWAASGLIRGLLVLVARDGDEPAVIKRPPDPAAVFALIAVGDAIELTEDGARVLLELEAKHGPTTVDCRPPGNRQEPTDDGLAFALKDCTRVAQVMRLAGRAWRLDQIIEALHRATQSCTASDLVRVPSLLVDELERLVHAGEVPMVAP